MPCEHGPESMPDGRILRPMAATSGEHCAPMRSNFSAKRSRKFSGREARHVCRRSVLRSVGTSAFLGLFPEVPSIAHAATAAIVTGAERLAAAAFAPLDRRRVGLITNQTGRVGAAHVADLLSSARGPRYDRLVSFGRKQLNGKWVFDLGKITGELAESYEVSPDGLKMTFRLRKDAKFQDGTPVTAEDVKWSSTGSSRRRSSARRNSSRDR